MAAERWKAIEGFEGLYDVSNMGRVRVALESIASHAKAPGEILGVTQGIYPQVTLRKDGAYHRRSVHVLVAAAFLGPRPAGMVINHISGRKTDSRAKNLEYITTLENTRHALRTGLKMTKAHGWLPLKFD